MIAFSYSVRGSISSPFCLILFLDFECCSGGDFVIVQISQSSNRERLFKIKYVKPEKLGPTKSVRLLLLMITLSIFGC